MHRPAHQVFLHLVADIADDQGRAGLGAARFVMEPAREKNQPRLPVGETLINTAALIASGLMLYFARRRYERSPASARMPLLFVLLLGGFFVVFQGIEWAALLREGLTMTSSAHGSFFYLIIGMHALHAVAALLVLAWAYARLTRNDLVRSQLATVEIFWYFVVALWPILYWRVYF